MCVACELFRSCPERVPAACALFRSCPERVRPDLSKVLSTAACALFRSCPAERVRPDLSKVLFNPVAFHGPCVWSSFRLCVRNGVVAEPSHFVVYLHIPWGGECGVQNFSIILFLTKKKSCLGLMMVSVTYCMSHDQANE